MIHKIPNRVKAIASFSIGLLLTLCELRAQRAPDAAELTTLLKEFLAGAGRNDAAMHERFWAEDLIYTGAAGRRRGKAELMKDVRAEPPTKPGEPATVYTAEDIRIQQYGESALVAFRLVATTGKAGTTQVANFLNTGTFLKRNGKWQAAGWQATASPRTEESSKKEVAAAQAAFHQALLSGDVKTLEAQMDETFVWTHQNGARKTRQQLLEMLSARQLKYSKLETSDVTVSVHRDTAVVRGASAQQRSSFPEDGGSGDPQPFTAFYTLTFVYKDGDWKALAMHSTRP